MGEVSDGAYKRTDVCAIKSNRSNSHKVILVKMHNIRDKLGVKNMSDLVRKKIIGKLNNEHPTKEEISRYKTNEREWSNDNDNTLIANDIASAIKKIVKKNANEFREKLGFEDIDLIMTNDFSSIITKVIKPVILGCRIDLHLSDHKVATVMKKVIVMEILTMKYKNKKQ